MPGAIAYVGGLDLTSFAGNRFDSSAHEPRIGIGWHDACLRIEGPAAADVAAHFRLRWPRPLPEPAAVPLPAEPAQAPPDTGDVQDTDAAIRRPREDDGEQTGERRTRKTRTAGGRRSATRRTRTSDGNDAEPHDPQRPTG